MDRRGPFLPIGHIDEQKDEEPTMKCIQHVPAVEAHTKIVEGEIFRGIHVEPLREGKIRLSDHCGTIGVWDKYEIKEFASNLMRLSEFM
jgi:hypothetical protein